MAFGRSNSLSLNTGATNSLFASQNNNNSNSTANNTATNNTTTNHTNMNSSQQPTTNPFGTASTSNSMFGLGGGGLGSMTANSNTNMFARPNNTSTTNTSSLFGGSTTQNNNNTQQPQQPQAPSLLGATQYNQMSQSSSTPFGRLSMGQNSNSTGNNNTLGAAKIDLDNLRPTTRFEDCVDQVKQEMEAIDKMIQEQEKYAKEIEAFLPKHAEDVNSIAPDVTVITDKAEDVEQALASDARGVDSQRGNAVRDRKDVERCQRIVTNLSLPQGYQYSGMNSTYGSMHGQQRPQQPPNSTNIREESANYDTDLIGNYFVPLAAELQKTMDAYASNLSEIESHMRVIESSAVAQAQRLAQRKAGVGGQQSGGDATVRELADTLKGFEESILGVASVVGECRDGVNELVLGRIGS